MTSFSLNMTCDSAAFDGDDIALEVAHILRNLAERIEEQDRRYLAGNGSRMNMRDSNGNNVGFATFDINEDDEE